MFHKSIYKTMIVIFVVVFFFFLFFFCGGVEGDSELSQFISVEQGTRYPLGGHVYFDSIVYVCGPCQGLPLLRCVGSFLVVQ